MAPSTLLTSHPAAGIVLVTLNRPESANALNTLLAQKLTDCFKKLSHEVRAVVLTGAGKHFSAGADLKERKDMNRRQWEDQHKHLRAARDAVLACAVPVIAAVNGAAMGGGCELALACDFIYVAETARFALPEATLGIMPGMGGTQGLPRAMGPRRARELLFTGRAFTAKEAYEWGMVNRICAPDRLMAEALEVATVIAGNAPLAVRAIKRAVRQGLSLPIPDALKLESKIYPELIDTRDRIEGISAFNEKRKAAFSGT